MQHERRFEFGKNWQGYAKGVRHGEIDSAVAGLRELVGFSTLAGRRMLDIGSGSGLSSVAALRLGASVVAFDFDEQSVQCTRELVGRFGASDCEFSLSRGSTLDHEFMSSLGTFDIVYSWGVLHHTGDMWTAIDLAARAVAPGGTFALAIYNDQGKRSEWWTRIKRAYNAGGPVVRGALLAGSAALMFSEKVFEHARHTGNPAAALLKLRETRRGMSRWYDLVDWVGGYPFEVASPLQVDEFLRQRGFEKRYERLVGNNVGCNEYRFVRV
jgi:2-polyprenyl-3-methyl-5-hydroxy-6-metoxy-1,4-benzoquinol methylase